MRAYSDCWVYDTRRVQSHWWGLGGGRVAYSWPGVRSWSNRDWYHLSTTHDRCCHSNECVLQSSHTSAGCSHGSPSSRGSPLSYWTSWTWTGCTPTHPLSPSWSSGRVSYAPVSPSPQCHRSSICSLLPPGPKPSVEGGCASISP